VPPGYVHVHRYTLQLLESNSEGVRAYSLASRLSAYGNGYTHDIRVRRLMLPFEEVIPPDVEPEDAQWGGFVPCGSRCVMYMRKPQEQAAPRAEAVFTTSGSSATMRSSSRRLRDGGTSPGCPCRAAAVWRAALERRLGEFMSEVVSKPYLFGARKALQAPAHRTVPASAAGRDRVSAPVTAATWDAVESSLLQPEFDAYLKSATPAQPHYYCSELLAAAFMRMGLLPPSVTPLSAPESTGATAGLSSPSLWGGSAGPAAASYWPNAWTAGSAVDALLPLGCTLEAPILLDPRSMQSLQAARGLQ
jgi:hypothetical protein